MNAVIIIVSLVVALMILIPFLEKYQAQMGLDKMQRFGKYIFPLVMISLIIKLIYELM
jgi:hypothetical protein